MATLVFNGLSFSYEPVPMSVRQSMQTLGDSYKQQKKDCDEPLVIPPCTSQLAEEAAGSLGVMSIEEYLH